ncbi:outer membrane autotransporter protein [Ochrobactrum sp. BH3]|nr:outer membrane autotransporter protein [Ochrobactrum sp. BH3]
MTLLRRAAAACASVCLMILTALCLNISAANAAQPIMTLGPDPMPDAKVGHFYGPVKLIASGGIGPYTFKRISLPGEDMNFELEGDSISGMVRIAGSTVFHIDVTDATGLTEQHLLHIHIDDPNQIRFDLDGLPLRPKEGKEYGPLQIKPTGGTEPYRIEARNLPRGVSLIGDTIHGTLQQSGSVVFHVTVTDAEDYSYSVGRGIIITPAPQIVVNDLPAGKIDMDYPTQKLSAAQGTEPYKYQVTGLPDGLKFDGKDTISGKPSQSGTFPVRIVVTDAEDYVLEKTDNLVITPRPDIDIDLNANRLPDGKQDLDYGAHKIIATGSTGFKYEVEGLPAGLSLRDDTVSGFPTIADTFRVTIIVTDKDGYTFRKSQDIAISARPEIDIDLNANKLPDGKQGIDYGSHKLVATGSAGFKYEVAGLPDGLSLRDDVVSGLPTVASTFRVTIIVTDKDGYVVKKSQDIVIEPKHVIDLGGSGLPDGEVGVEYSSTINATGGTEPYSYVVSGLPEGLTSSGNVVDGKPSKAGSFDVTIVITDADGYSVTSHVPLLIIKKPTLEAQNHDLTVMAGTTGSVNLAQGATGDTITSAAILSEPNAAAGKARVESGANAQMLYFAASATFAGSTELTYRLISANGASEPATVTIHVIERPDPSKDAEVIGLVSAQVQTANRMAQTQIRNFGQRLEQLHGEGECRQDSIGLNVGLDGAQLNPKMPQVCSGRELSVWTNGEINMGKSSSDDNAKDRKLDHTSIGLSGGVDYRFSPSFTGGIGFGYGKDTTDIGQNGTKSRATMTSLAAYSSYRPGKSFFLDAVVGYGWLNFESDRFVTATGGMANGERKGQQIFGSVTLGYDYRNEAWLLSPYLRADMAHTKLEGFSETGAGIHNLTYGDQTADLLSATIGLRGEYTIPMSWGTLKPKARLEYSHDFAGSSRVKLGYTDIGGLLPYTIDANSTAKDSIRIDAGFDAMINGDWSAGLDYSTQIGTGGGKLEHGFRWKLSKPF